MTHYPPVSKLGLRHLGQGPGEQAAECKQQAEEATPPRRAHRAGGPPSRIKQILGAEFLELLQGLLPVVPDALGVAARADRFHYLVAADQTA